MSALLWNLFQLLSDNPKIFAVVIVPMWPAQAWFTPLLRLADKAYLLPPKPDLFLPGYLKDNYSPRPPKWETLALRIPPRLPNQFLGPPRFRSLP